MDYVLTNFWSILTTQRDWSWAVIGLVFFLAFLLLRSFFLRGLIKRARGLNSKWFQEVKKSYVRHCAGGWVLFAAAFSLLIFFWETANLEQASLYEIAMCFLILLTALLAVMSHLIGFGISLIHVLKQLENNQMTL